MIGLVGAVFGRDTWAGGAGNEDRGGGGTYHREKNAAPGMGAGRPDPGRRPDKRHVDKAADALLPRRRSRLHRRTLSRRPARR